MNSDPHTLRIEHSTAYSSITLRTCAMSSCPSPSCAMAASIMPTVRYAIASPVKMPAAMLASFRSVFIDHLAHLRHVFVPFTELCNGRIHHADGAIRHSFTGKNASRHVG